MTKFISKENLQTYHNLLQPKIDKKLNAPEGGENGQVLTKTSSGTEWKTLEVPDIDNVVNKSELENYLTKTEASNKYQTKGNYLVASDIESKANKATTLAGYGITDAKIANGVITLGANSITPLTSHQSLSAYAKTADLAAVAKTGNYNDLENTPTIGNATINIQKNGTTVDSFTTNATATKNINITLAKGDVGLGNVTNDAQVKRSEMGVASGVATLGTDGKVPSSQLPSYVDDVLEYATKSSFPTTGETGKIYVDTTTNLTYRWSGTAYVEISPSIALGETSSTAYAGDKGKAVTDAFNTHKSDTTVHITAAERSAWNAKTNNTGTVTSVTGKAATGSNLTVSGTVTTSGDITVGVASGYSIPATSKQTEWDGKQAAISDLATIRSNASDGATAYSWGNHASAGYTKNTGTVTQVKVGTTAYNPSSGVITLPAYPTTLPASDVSDWAKAEAKPSYSWSEITGKPTLNSGTVTSVAMTAPTGLSVSGSPITSSGTLALTFATGYSIPTTAKQTAWDGKQDNISDLATIRSNATNGNTAYGWGNHTSAGYLKSVPVATTSAVGTVKVGSGLAVTTDGTISANNQVTDAAVSGLGFTKNAGTVTQVKIGTTAYDPTSGVVSLPAYPTVLTNTNQLTNGAGFITSSGSITGNAATATTATNLANAPTLAKGTSDANNITVTAGGKTSAEFTVPYATAAGSSASCTGNAATATTATNATQLGGVAAANYLQSSTAANTYLTKTDASSTYQPKGSYLTSHQDISGKADKASVTQGSTGNATATSGATISVPYVNVNSQGIVTGYGNRTHTVTGFTNNAGTVTSVSGAAAAGSNLTLTGTVTSSGSLTVGVASGYSIPSTDDQTNWNDAYSFLFGHNTATSIANIPITKRLVIATISATGSFSLASTPTSGREIHVIINNSSTSDITVTIPNSGGYKSAIGTELKIKASSFGEVNVISDGTTMYVRGA